MNAVRVLICDDEPSLRTLLTIALDLESDLEVVASAADGLEALELAERFRPDVILLDLVMPKMDGLQALAELRKALPGARVVVLSGLQESLMGETVRDLGAAAFVEKGTDPSTIAATIRQAAA
jgi:DNA-binding NarL/FixJ family response regulator